VHLSAIPNRHHGLLRPAFGVVRPLITNAILLPWRYVVCITLSVACYKNIIYAFHFKMSAFIFFSHICLGRKLLLKFSAAMTCSLNSTALRSAVSESMMNHHAQGFKKVQLWAVWKCIRIRHADIPLNQSSYLLLGLAKISHKPGSLTTRLAVNPNLINQSRGHWVKKAWIIAK